jgi:2-methylisocitrate lyase-like PEP mutase family enzyme
MTAVAMPDRSAQFLALHRPGDPLLLPNPWDVGTARVLASIGFSALATTSSGFAASLGRADGSVTRAEALAHAHSIVIATDRPVSADLENGFGPSATDVAETVRLAIDAGLAGCSIEDYTGDEATPIYDLDRAVDRIRAAADAAHSGSRKIVLTARAENHLHGRDDLADTIERLTRYQRAGADVVYAPGLVRLADIAALVAAVDVPVNVLASAGTPSIAELAAVGVARVSIGGAFAYAALGALVVAAEEFRGGRTADFSDLATRGREAARVAFG